MKNYTHIIHTGMYSAKAFETFQALRKALLRTTHRYTWFYRALDILIVDQSTDNEVILAFEYHNPFSCGNESKFMENLSYKIKEYIKKRIVNWSRDNDTNLTVNVSNNNGEQTLNFEVRMAYFIYDKFLKRPKIEQKYPSDFIKDFVSIPLDPITAEMKASQLEEIDSLTKEYDGKMSQLRHDAWSEKDQACKLIDEKYQKLLRETREELDKKIAEIKDGLNTMIAALQ